MLNNLATPQDGLQISFARAVAIALVTVVVMVCLSPGISAQQADEGKGWKELIPLRSTRRDVEALIGPPATGGSSFYQTDQETVFVHYSDGPCEKGWPYGWNVDKGTVVSIVVSPKQSVMWKDLNLDQNKYRPSRDGHINTKVHYANHSEGITIDVDEVTGRVTSFIYHPTDSQQKLQCPDASGRLPVGRTQADSLFKFDEYGDLPPDLERERLDNVAAVLLRRPETKAYLIAYAGPIAQKGEAAARATCAGNYLIKKHHIQPDRVQAIDGGYREMRLVEVYVEEKDGPLPLARPTLRPSEVKFTQQKTLPTCRLQVDNGSNLVFKLSRPDGTLIRELRMSGAGGDWTEAFDLSEGTYKLSEPNHSTWICTIIVQ